MTIIMGLRFHGNLWIIVIFHAFSLGENYEHSFCRLGLVQYVIQYLTAFITNIVPTRSTSILSSPFISIFQRIWKTRKHENRKRKFFFNWVIKRGKSENRFYKSWKEYVVTWPKGLWMVINFSFVLRVIVADLWLNCWNILELISLPHLFVPLLWTKDTKRNYSGFILMGVGNSKSDERDACRAFINEFKGRLDNDYILLTIF